MTGEELNSLAWWHSDAAEAQKREVAAAKIWPFGAAERSGPAGLFIKWGGAAREGEALLQKALQSAPWNPQLLLPMLVLAQADGHEAEALVVVGRLRRIGLNVRVKVETTKAETTKAERKR